jgi:4-amino-4-deoxy-L-arabinose transferase-like glycosyltransferase
MDTSTIKRLGYTYPLLTAFVARAASFVLVDLNTFNWSLPKPDILMEYGVIARNLAKGAGYSYSWGMPGANVVNTPTAYMPPGQVFIDFAAIAIFGDTLGALIALFILNVVFSTAAVYLIAKIAEELFGKKRYGRSTAWLAALYPPFIYSVATFGITSAVILIGAFISLMVIRLSKSIAEGKRSGTLSILAGAGFGTLMLFRAETPLYLLLTLSLIAWNHGKEVLPKLSIVFVVAFVVAAPWIGRNYMVFDKLIVTSSNGGMNLWRGNNPQIADHTIASIANPLWSNDELDARIAPYLDSGARYESMSSKIYFTNAVEWARANPFDAGFLSLKKGVLFWTFAAYRDSRGAWIFWILYFATVLFFFYGLFVIARTKAASRADNGKDMFGVEFIGAWCIASTVIAMIFFPQLRLQVITSAMYFPISAYGLSAAAEKFFRKQHVHFLN